MKNDKLLTNCPSCNSINVESVFHRQGRSSSGDYNTSITIIHDATIIDEMICLDCGHAWIYRRANPKYIENRKQEIETRKAKDNHDKVCQEFRDEFNKIKNSMPLKLIKFLEEYEERNPISLCKSSSFVNSDQKIISDRGRFPEEHILNSIEIRYKNFFNDKKNIQSLLKLYQEGVIQMINHMKKYSKYPELFGGNNPHDYNVIEKFKTECFREILNNHYSIATAFGKYKWQTKFIDQLLNRELVNSCISEMKLI